MTNNDTIAERLIDLQYDDDIVDSHTLYGFLDEYLQATSPALIPADLDDQRATLIDAIEYDLLDLLENDLLLDEDEDIALVDDTAHRREVCTLIADKLLARIR